MAGIDRNAANSMRLRRNQQRGKAGSFTSTIRVAAPLQNTGSQIQLNLDSAGGLESSSSLLRVKLIDTSLTRTASGLGVNLRGGSGMLISTGLGILLDGASLSLGASGIKLTGYLPYAPGASVTIPTGNFAIQSRRLTMTGAQRLTIQGTGSMRIT
jgi:hypothetical protein